MNGFALMYLPHTGLFYDGGSFLDGRGQVLGWNGTLEVYESRAQALAVKKKLLDKDPRKYQADRIVLIKVEVRMKTETRREEEL